jgi:tRNA-specific 2-thiouridylase
LEDKDGIERYQLLAGKDGNKDQSYFLCQLSQAQLSKTVFPIGELTKPEVRAIATKMDLVTADKKDSQGLCFIGKVRLPEFLQQQLKPKTGKIVQVPATVAAYQRVVPTFSNRAEELAFYAEKAEYHLEDGRVVGEHQGAHYFTKGQRKGLNIGGTKEPLFVIETDVKENIIYTGEGKAHPGLYRRTLFVKDAELHWVRPDLSLVTDGELRVLARIRYRQELQKAILYKVAGGMYVDFEVAQSAIQEGQFVAWYLEDELIGSGVIS